MADYLASNAAVPELRAHIVETIRARMSATPDVAEVAEARLTDAVLGVQEAYLDAARSAIVEDFGSFDGYLDASGVTADDIAKLRVALRG
jgi:protein-tyrosine phosphatase